MRQPVRSDAQMKRRPSFRKTCVGLVSTQPVGHSSRRMTRHAPVVGSAAANSMDVLPAVRPREQQLLAVRRPRHAVDVVADHVVVEGLAAAHVDLDAGLRRDVVHEEIDDRVGLAGLRIGLDVDRAVELGLIHLQEVVGHLASRRSGSRRASRPSGDHHIAVVCASSSPYTQLAVPYLIRSFSLPSVVTGDFVRARGVADEEVAVLVERLQRLVGRLDRGHLPAARRRRRPESRAAAGSRRRGAPRPAVRWSASSRCRSGRSCRPSGTRTPCRRPSR